MEPITYTIAFYMHDLSGGGVERMRLKLAHALAQRGHHVTLIVQFLAGALRDRIPDGVNVVVLGKSGVAESALALAKILRVEQPEILVSSLDHNNIAAICAGILSGGRTRIVICQHNALSAERALGWKYRAIPILYRLLHRHAAAIVAVSHGVADDLASITGIARARIEVIANPVIDSAEGQNQTGGIPHPWLKAPHPPVFVFVGRLVPQKDAQTLLTAFARRLRAGSARLIILGEGPLLQSLRTQADTDGIAEHVYFAGFVTDPAAWVACAHALVMPSRYEGFGNAIVEALACGTPVIATNCPHGPAEILAGGQFGRLVPVGDARALANAMKGDLRAQFPAGLLRWRAAAFSVAACVDRHEALFARALAARNRAFGLAFSRLDASGVANFIAHSPPADRVRLIVTPNSDHIRLLQRPVFAAAYNSAAVICPDGEPVALYGWLRGAAALRRVTGCDIFQALVRHAALPRLRVFVVTETAHTEAALRDWLAPRGLTKRWQIATAPTDIVHDSAGAAAILRAITAFAPDVLVMTLGAPVSEEFVHLNTASLPGCWALCIGQAVRVELGLVRRAPRIIKAAGLEWAWRIAQEPRRLTPRYLAGAVWLPRAIYRDLRNARH